MCLTMVYCIYYIKYLDTQEPGRLVIDLDDELQPPKGEVVENDQPMNQSQVEIHRQVDVWLIYNSYLS